MITNEEARKAIEKYQKEHPLYFGQMIDVTAISSKAGAEIISRTVEEISKKVEEDTDLWYICEMAKMYMRGVKPVYPARQQGEWEYVQYDSNPNIGNWHCSECRHIPLVFGGYSQKPYYNFCPNCGADMRKGGAE